MRFEKRLQLAVLYGFDPDNENRVAIVCAMLSKTETEFGLVRSAWKRG